MKTKSTSAKPAKKPKARVRDMRPKKDTKGGTSYGRGSFAIRLSDTG